MESSDISEQSKKLMSKVTSAVEKAGSEVSSSFNKVTGGAFEGATEEVIQTAVDQALDILKVAGDQVRSKNMNTERVKLQVDIGIANVAQLRIMTDVPSEKNAEAVDVELS